MREHLQNQHIYKGVIQSYQYQVQKWGNYQTFGSGDSLTTSTGEEESTAI